MAFDAGTILSTLDVRRDPFQAGLKAARGEGAEFARQTYQATLGVKGDKAAAAAAARLRGELDALTRPVDIPLRLRGDRSTLADLTAIGAAVKAIDGSSVDVGSSSNMTRTRTDLGEIAGLVQGLDGRTMRLAFDLDAARTYSDLVDVDTVVSRLDGRTMRLRMLADGAAQTASELTAVDTLVSRLDGASATVYVRDNAATIVADTATAAAAVQDLDGDRATVGFQGTAAPITTSAEQAKTAVRALDGTTATVVMTADEAKAAKLRAQIVEVTGDLQRLAAEKANPTVDLQIAAAMARGDQIVALIRDLSAMEATPEVQAKIAKAELDLGKIMQLIATLNVEKASPEVDAQIAAAEANLASLRAQLAALGAVHETATVDVDTSSAESNVRGLYQLIAALVPMISPIGGAALGALGAFGTGAAVAVGALGSTLIATRGVGDAVSALKAQQADSAKTAAKAGAQQVSNANAVRSATASLQGAEESLAHTRENNAYAATQAAKRVADARTSAADDEARAIKAHEAAEDDLSAALADQTRVRADLTQAQEDARRSLQDLEFQARGGEIAAREAAINLAEATQKLNEAQRSGVTGKDLDKLQIGYDKASLSVDELTVRNQRLGQEQQQAAKNGVEGSAQVVAARDKIAQADKRVADAQEKVRATNDDIVKAQREGSAKIAEAIAAQAKQARDARYSEATALRSVEQAQQSLAQAHAKTGTAGVAAADKVKEAFKGTGPAFQQFVRDVLALEPVWDQVKLAGQEALLPPLSDAINRLPTLLPRVQSFVGAYAGAVGKLGDRTSKALFSDEWLDNIAWLENQATPTIDRFGTIAGNSLSGLFGVVRGFSSIWYEMGDGLESFTERFSKWGQEVGSGKNEGFNTFISYVEKEGPHVVDVLGDLVDAGVNIARGMAPVGGVLLTVVGAAARLIAALPPEELTLITAAVLAFMAAFKTVALIDKAGTALDRFGTRAATIGGKVKATAVDIATGVAGLVNVGPAASKAGQDLDGLGAKAVGAAGPSGIGKIASAGGALIGFLGGPWGIAIAGATLAVSLLSAKYAESAAEQAKVKAQTDGWKDALLDSKLVVDDNIRSMVARDVAARNMANADGTAGDAAKALGVTLDQLGTAVTGSDAAYQQQIDSLNKVAAAHELATPLYNNALGVLARVGPSYDEAGQKARGLADSVQQARDQFRQQEDEAAAYRAATNSVTLEQQKMNDSIQRTIDLQLQQSNSNLSFREAKLRLKEAQEALNDAVGKYGPKSDEAEQASINLERAQNTYIESAGRSKGATDGSAQALDQQRQAAYNLASTIKGDIPPAVETMVAGMDRTQLAALGAKIKIDDTGQAVAVLPNGKEIKLTAATAQADTDVKNLGRTVADNTQNKTFTITGKFNWIGADSPLLGILASHPAGASVNIQSRDFLGILGRHSGGGVIPGYEPGIDRVPALLSRGESVLVPELTRAIGPSNILAANRSASGRTPARYAAGGIVGGAGAAAPMLASALGPVAAAAGPAAAAATATDPAAGAAALGDMAAAQRTVQAGSGATVQALQAQASALSATGTAASTSLAALQSMQADGLSPLADQLQRQTFPTLDQFGAKTGGDSVAATHALTASFGPLGQALQASAATTAKTASSSAQDLERYQDRADVVFSGVRGGLDTVAGAHRNVATVTQAQWNLMRGYTADPARYVLTGPINAGLVGAWNKLNEQFNLNKPVQPVGVPFATGGRVPGQGNTDNVPSLLTPGEFVLSKPAITALGGIEAVEDLHKRARRAAGGLAAGKPRAGAYAAGGEVLSLAAAANVLGQLHPGPAAAGATRPPSAGVVDMTSILGADWSRALDDANSTTARFGGSVGALDARGMATGIIGAAQTKASNVLMTSAAPAAGAGVQRWRGLVLQALGMVGQPASLVDVVLRRMNQESGGNPRAINLWDINAKRGTPSKGLMQTIDSTFRAYHFPGTSNDVYDPLANVLASMNYAKARYGSLAAAYNRAGGYDNGGELPPGYTLAFNGTGRPENVRTAEQAAREDGGRGPDLIAALEQMTVRLEQAVTAARAVHVHPREGQSEEGIAASVLRREELSRRLG